MITARQAAAARMQAHRQAMAMGKPELSPYAPGPTAEEQARIDNRDDKAIDRGLVQWW
jgi:hypothetical protein